MASILLFHSALGLTEGVLNLAAELRRDGHRVLTPDLFDGETFRDHQVGAVKRDALGIPELMRRAQVAAEAAPEFDVFAGCSMGTGAAQFLAMTRPRVRGLLLMHGALPLQVFAPSVWPGVPVQVHASESDPFVEWPVIEDLAQTIDAQVFRYPGSAHLFAEPTCSDFNPRECETLTQRVREFFLRIDAIAASGVSVSGTR